MRHYLGGTAATYKDIHDASMLDLMILVIAALGLIFPVMLGITRALAASAVIVGTVAGSITSAMGLSVLIWQHLLHMPLGWVVVPMSVIVMLAVGSDYNLLLVSRMQEEIHAGLKTGIIRSMGGTGGVVTTAGLVFAFTMGGMLVSDVRTIGQIGTTIMIGLLLDTLVVRSFLVPRSPHCWDAGSGGRARSTRGPSTRRRPHREHQPQRTQPASTRTPPGQY